MFPVVPTAFRRVIPALGFLLLGSPVFAGEVYSFTSELRGGLQETSTTGTILVDGNRYRIEYGSDDPLRTHGAVVSQDGGEHAFALNLTNRTFFELEGPSPDVASSPLFALIPVWGERTATNVKLEVTAGTEPETIAGIGARRHDVALSYQVSISIELPPLPNSRVKPRPEMVSGTVTLKASYWMAEDRAPLPVRGFQPEIRTGFPEIDDRLRAALGALRGLAVKQQVAVTSAGDQGVAPRTETSLQEISSVRSRATQAAMFEVPSSFRMHKPEITRPGLESAPGFN